MTFTVQFGRIASAQLTEILRYVSQEASLATAERFTGRLVDFCLTLSDLPYRGHARVDIHPCVRVLPFRKQAIIVYRIDGQIVTVLGVFRRGQDYESALPDLSLDL